MDHDVLIWQEADGWRWQLVAVGPDGRDRGVTAEGVAKSEALALAAGEAAKPPKE